jgi:hypothetical protein
LAFEWSRNAFFLWQLAQLFTALGVGKAVKAVLAIHYHLDPLWVSPLWMLTTAAVLAVFAWKSDRRSLRRTGWSPSWDAVADFSITENPVGPWSYGWSKNGLGSGFVRHTRNLVDAQPGVDRWDSPAIQQDVGVMHNKTGNDIRPPGYVYTISRDMLHMHPGDGGIYDIVRWECPQGGKYAIIGQFCGLDDNTQGDSDVNVVLKSQQPLFGPTSPVLHGIGSKQEISFVDILLSPGDTVDFIVGVGRGYGSDSTGLKVKIVLQ